MYTIKKVINQDDINELFMVAHGYYKSHNSRMMVRTDSDIQSSIDSNETSITVKDITVPATTVIAACRNLIDDMLEKKAEADKQDIAFRAKTKIKKQKYF